MSGSDGTISIMGHWSLRKNKKEAPSKKFDRHFIVVAASFRAARARSRDLHATVNSTLE